MLTRADPQLTRDKFAEYIMMYGHSAGLRGSAIPHWLPLSPSKNFEKEVQLRNADPPDPFHWPQTHD